jgi:hypothetical protein
VHDGQTVLFVAEKMAALNVVRARLQAAGLDDICLELHSQDTLNLCAKRLHAEIGDTAITPFQALSIQIAAAARGFMPDARLVEEAAHWSGKDFAQ